MDGIPSYLMSQSTSSTWDIRFKVPSPEEGFENFAELYGQEYVDVVIKIGLVRGSVSSNWTVSWRKDERTDSPGAW